MRFLFVVLLVLCVFFSCRSDQSNIIDVSKVSVDYSVKRFEQDFYQANVSSLPKVREKYPFLFPETMTDSIALAKINHQDEKALFSETQKVYENFNSVNDQLEDLFKRIKYDYPKFNAPDVVTMITNIDYENRVIYADSLLLVSLDAYLGSEHSFYEDYPSYIKENNSKAHIAVDVANALIDVQLMPSSKRRFIDKMITEGKRMYLLDRYLPFISDKEKIGYAQDKLEWALANEEQIWVYFIENKLLYSTDTQLNYRFLKEAPFSKFYMEQDNLSPGRIGVWLGWQIVRSFMEKNDVSLQKFLKMDEEEIFKNSKYKPRN